MLKCHMYLVPIAVLCPRKNKACSNTSRTATVGIGGRGVVFIAISPCFACISVAFVDTYKYR